MTDLHPNMKIIYKTDPETVGWVIGIDGETARVFVDGAIRLVPMRELEAAPGLVKMGPAELKNALVLRRLEHPLTDQLLSYRASKTDLYYHQFLPVKKMLESPDQRILIADEVGTGKTIEAGLIWAELESRAADGLGNVWVICPKSLVGKWRDEMLQRFDLRLEPLSSKDLRQALVTLERDGILSPRFARCVVNLELIRAEEHQAKLEGTAIEWDLAIFDEAHHLRNPETLSHGLARLICGRSKAALFLTATPLQTSLLDVVHLMEALGVDVAESPDLLEEQMRWDMELNDWIHLIKHRPPDWRQESEKTLRRLEAEGGRDRSGWAGFRQLEADSDLDDRGQRTVVVGAARDLQALSPYMTRTLRSDVDEARPTREAITRTVEFSAEESAFYSAVYEVCMRRAEDNGAPAGFITQMPERRTASCVPAVAAEILGYAAEDEDEDERASFTREEVLDLKPFARAALGSEDRKLEALCEILERVFGELGMDRVMIFSTFRGTLHYLRKELGARGYSLGLMYGPTPARDEDCRRGEKSRERIGAEFRRGEFQVLLASEVAGEGLDFEHCSVVVNYDLPWNPMRVEQRIGRCDRLGQRSEKVYVGNLASRGTIEGRILSRLYERLRVFERAMGDMEAVLGEEIASFEQDVFRSGLSPQEQNEQLERISQAIENKKRQMEEVAESGVISEQGQQLIESEEIKEAESRFLSPEDVSEFVHASLDGHLPGSVSRTLGAGQFEVRATDELRDALRGLLTAYPATHYARIEIARFRKRLDEQTRVSVSFMGDVEDVEFAHARHPLALLARRLARGSTSDVPYCVGMSASVDAATVAVWATGSLEGYTSRVELVCAAVDCASVEVNPVSVEQAQEWLRTLEADTNGGHGGIDVDALVTEAERALMEQLEELGETFRARNELLAEKARQAVRSHAERELGWLNRQLSRDDLDRRIRNMHRGRVRNLEAATRSKLDDIERKNQMRSSLEIIGAAVIYPAG